jgi:hypothetical protein
MVASAPERRRYGGVGDPAARFAGVGVNIPGPHSRCKSQDWRQRRLDGINSPAWRKKSPEAGWLHGKSANFGGRA